MKDTLKKQLGRYAEQKARHYLETQGLRLITQNYQIPAGEVDLIMQDGDDIVFVEVRARSNKKYGSAIESVSLTKQKKLIKSAIFYLLERKWFNKVNCRFDIVGVSETQIEWVANAFSTDRFL